MAGWNKDLITGGRITITNGSPATITWGNGLPPAGRPPDGALVAIRTDGALPTGNRQQHARMPPAAVLFRARRQRQHVDAVIVQDRREQNKHLRAAARYAYCLLDRSHRPRSTSTTSISTLAIGNRGRAAAFPAKRSSATTSPPMHRRPEYRTDPVAPTSTICSCAIRSRSIAANGRVTFPTMWCSKALTCRKCRLQPYGWGMAIANFRCAAPGSIRLRSVQSAKSGSGGHDNHQEYLGAFVVRRLERKGHPSVSGWQLWIPIPRHDRDHCHAKCHLRLADLQQAADLRSGLGQHDLRATLSARAAAMGSDSPIRTGRSAATTHRSAGALAPPPTIFSRPQSRSGTGRAGTRAISPAQ